MLSDETSTTSLQMPNQEIAAIGKHIQGLEDNEKTLRQNFDTARKGWAWDEAELRTKLASGPDESSSWSTSCWLVSRSWKID